MVTKENVKAGDVIHIYHMFGEPDYCGAEGVVKFIENDVIYGTWGELPLHYDDDWEIMLTKEVNEEGN